MQQWDMYLSFKGKRAYIRGSDVYHAVADRLAGLAPVGDWREFRLVFRSIITCHSRLVLDPAGGDPPAESAAVCTALGPDGEFSAWVLQGAEPIAERVELDDDRQVYAALVMGEGECSLRRIPGIRTVDCLVSMAKKLSETRHPTPGSFWIFTRLEAPRLPSDEAGELAVREDRVLPGKFIKFALQGDGKDMGVMFFSLIKDQA
jgi:hypothetical protein